MELAAFIILNTGYLWVDDAGEDIFGAIEKDWLLLSGVSVHPKIVRKLPESSRD